MQTLAQDLHNEIVTGADEVADWLLAALQAVCSYGKAAALVLCMGMCSSGGGMHAYLKTLPLCQSVLQLSTLQTRLLVFQRISMLVLLIRPSCLPLQLAKRMKFTTDKRSVLFRPHDIQLFRQPPEDESKPYLPVHIAEKHNFGWVVKYTLKSDDDVVSCLPKRIGVESCNPFHELCMGGKGTLQMTSWKGLHVPMLWYPSHGRPRLESHHKRVLALAAGV